MFKFKQVPTLFSAFLVSAFVFSASATGAGSVKGTQEQAAKSGANGLRPVSVTAAKVATTRPAREFQVAGPITDVSGYPEREVVNPGVRFPKVPKGAIRPFEIPYGGGDAAIGSAPLAPSVMPPTIVNFEGIGLPANASLFGFTVFPPDTVGDVGRNHYVQSVNSGIIQVFRLDGTPLTGAFALSSLFAALGPSSACIGDDDGDPIVLYDSLADRWMLSQFATEGPPFHQCIAISQSGDPTGAYYVYDFLMPVSKFNDYPHFGVWPDGYYMTDNQFNAALTTFQGAGVFAFDRVKMLAGDPTASYIYFDLFGVDPNLGGMLPSDLDGPPPPAGTKNVFAMFTATEFGDPGGDGMRLWEFTPDYATPANSTFLELTTETVPLAVAEFDPLTPAGRRDIFQPGGVLTEALDSIGDRLMHRMQYRYFGTHSSLVLNHTVDVSGNPAAATYRSGVRYYELRNTGAGWTVNEQDSHASDDTTLNYWMGSAAMDRQGNLAVGYSTSGSDPTEFPSIGYAARLAADPPGGLAQGEAVAVVGGRKQADTRSRWGDYSSLNVDPVDDCTFWYTQEYYAPVGALTAACGTSLFCWQTRVFSFRLPSCTSAPLQGRIQGVVRNSVTNAPVPGATVVLGNGYAGTSDGAGGYAINVPASSYTGVATKSGYTPDTELLITVAAGGVVTRDFQIVGVPILDAVNPIANDNVAGGNANNLIDFDECPAITITANNSGAAIATNTQGVLSTSAPGVTVTTANANFGSITPGFGANSLTPFVIQTAPTFVPGSPINFSLALTSTEGSWNETISLATGIGNDFGFPSATTPAAIPDNLPAGVNVPIVVSGLTSPVSDVQLALRITHSWVGDLVATLSGPGGVPVVNLFTSPGASGVNNSSDNLGADCPAGSNDLILSATGTAPIQGIASANNTVGTFTPEAAFTPFSGIVGNGSWTLNVRDIAAQDTGTVECVALKIGNFTYTSGNCSVPLPDNMFADGFE